MIYFKLHLVSSTGILGEPVFLCSSNTVSEASFEWN